MGQYWKILNLDKKESINPHDFDNGAKFLEFAGGGGLMFALATLTAAPQSMGAGGGDAELTDWTGRWAGDRIVIVGDYTDSGPFANLYGDESFTPLKFNQDLDQ